MGRSFICGGYLKKTIYLNSRCSTLHTSVISNKCQTDKNENVGRYNNGLRVNYDVFCSSSRSTPLSHSNRFVLI